MSQDTGKTLFGPPVVVTDAVAPNTVIVGPAVTAEDIQRHGTYEKAVQARASEYSKLVIPEQKKATNTVNVSRETLESIKRTLYNAIDKLERMASPDKK